MDKIVLTENDMNIFGYIEYGNIERNLDLSICPLRAFELIVEDIRVKYIRESNCLKAYVYLNDKFTFRVDIKIECAAHRVTAIKSTPHVPDDVSMSVRCVYLFLMDFLINANEGLEKTTVDEIEKTHHINLSKDRRKNSGTVYILNRSKTVYKSKPKGYHSSPQGIFSVRGHLRHYKNGNTVWIKEFQKGTGDKKSKTYKLIAN